jgi:SAM-dependent methyltransferase
MRLLRRQTPQWVVDAMLDRGVYLKPAGDTSLPTKAVRDYSEIASRHGLSLAGQRVCVVGSGGGLGIGIALLEAGVREAILQEPFAPQRPARDKKLLAPALVEKYLISDEHGLRPRDERLLLVRETLERFAVERPGSVDFIVSKSVLEHVENLDSLIAASAQLLQPDGINIHFVDMRDHYFRYPFEMLAYTQKTWDRWLKASNTLNRLRRNDYERIFRRYYDDVRIETILALPEEFARMKPRIRREFLTGDDAIDAIGAIRIEARRPKRIA